jgi:hypothetical protein
MLAPCRRWSFALVCAACATSIVGNVFAQGEPPPVDPPGDAPAQGDPPRQLHDNEDTWGKSPDPASRFWYVTPYLKGTPAEIRATLDAQVTEFDGKLADVLAEIAQNDRDAASQSNEALAAARASAPYKAAQAQADAARAELEAARAAGASVEQRMTAGSKYNRAKADVDKIERDAVARTTSASRKTAREKLQARADTFYTRRAEALAWRQRLVDAILLGQTIRGRMEPGRTIGLLSGARVERVTPDREVLARFPLLERHEITGDKEGVKQIQGRAEEVRLLIRGLDDVQRLRPKQELTLSQVFKVSEVRDVDGKEAYVLEPFPCDFNVLLHTIVKPPTLKAPPRGITAAATMPVKQREETGEAKSK